MRRDPVTPDVALTVLRRDQGCVAVALGEPPDTCGGRLTLDHVKDQPRMGKRAPSDPAHLVSLCYSHHLDGWATGHRPALREYLRTVDGSRSNASGDTGLMFPKTSDAIEGTGRV